MASGNYGRPPLISRASKPSFAPRPSRPPNAVVEQSHHPQTQVFSAPAPPFNQPVHPPHAHPSTPFHAAAPAPPHQQVHRPAPTPRSTWLGDQQQQHGTNPLAQSAPPPVSRVSKPTAMMMPTPHPHNYSQSQPQHGVPPHTQAHTPAQLGGLSQSAYHQSAEASVIDWRQGVGLPPLPCIVSSITDGELTRLGGSAGQLFLELRTYPQTVDPSTPPDQIHTGELSVRRVGV
jgi:hypothetical protein